MRQPVGFPWFSSPQTPIYLICKKTNVFCTDTGRTHGWQVRIARTGEQHTRLFSDAVHEGTGAAYEGVEHRNEKLDELPDLPDGPAGQLHTDEVHQRRWQSVTRTGVKGLGFTMTNYSNATDAKRPYVSALAGRGSIAVPASRLRSMGCAARSTKPPKRSPPRRIPN